MPTVTFAYRDERERVALELAAAFVAEMHSLAQAAPAGHVLHACEGHALAAGRQLLRDALQQAVQARAEDAEQKGGRRASARARVRSASSGVATAK